MSNNLPYRVLAKVPGTVRALWNDYVINVPVDFLGPARRPGSGVTVNARADDGSLILLSGFFDGGTELRLIRRDGTIVARWPVRFLDHFPEATYLNFVPMTNRNVDLHGELIEPDGSVLFNYEYLATVKLSRCGDVIWRLPRGNNHSIEAAEGGGYWIPGRNLIENTERDPFPPFTSTSSSGPTSEDLIMRVAEDGTVLEEKSIPRILYDNGLEPLLTATGGGMTWDRRRSEELVHVNKIAELPSAIADRFPGFESGDLMISVRTHNLIFVVDPDTWRVKWHRTGPWRRQHDPDFEPDGTITVFNNNVYNFEDPRDDLEGLPRDGPAGASPGLSNIIRMDPATGEWEVAYGGKPGEEFLSTIRGKHESTPDGGFLITEFEAGRVFEVDAAGDLVWEYVNRYDEDRALEVTGARLYPASYFEVDDWSCPGTAGRAGAAAD